MAQKDHKVEAGTSRNIFFHPNESPFSYKHLPVEERGVLGELLVSQAELSSRNRELRQTIEVLSEKMGMYAGLFTYAPASYFIVSSENTIEDVNLAGAAMLGIERGVLLGSPITDFIAGEDREQFTKFHSRLRQSGPGHTLRLRMNKAGKRLFWAEFKGVVHFEGTQNKDRLLLIIADISKDKQLEPRFSQSAKNEIIGTFASGIAHDFNNILQSILGYSELVLAGLGDNKTLKERQEMVIGAANRAKDLVKKIFTFSRRAELPVKPIHIHPIIKAAVSALRSSVPDNILIKLDLDSPGCAVMADSGQIHQVFVNICSNACTALEDRGGTITISLKKVTVDAYEVSAEIKPGKYLLLEISDNGPGMSPEMIGKIFDPYYSTKKKGEGKGLGLAIVNYIVNRHGGGIAVESEPGQGTSFRVYIPCVQESKTRLVESSLERIEVKPDTAQRILVVDDEPLIASFQKEILEKMKYSVTAFSDSNEALQAFIEQPQAFSLVLTDMTMPNISGLQLVRQIKNIRPDIPVVLSSGYAGFIDEIRETNRDINDYLEKPFTKEELVDVINKTMGGRGGGQLVSSGKKGPDNRP